MGEVEEIRVQPPVSDANCGRSEEELVIRRTPGAGCIMDMFRASNEVAIQRSLLQEKFACACPTSNWAGQGELYRTGFTMGTPARSLYIRLIPAYQQ